MTKPVKVVRAGGVRAAVWENTVNRDGKEIPVFSVQIDRTYKDGDQFKQTSRFNLQDLPKVALVAGKAYEFLTLKDQESDPNDEGT